MRAKQNIQRGAQAPALLPSEQPFGSTTWTYRKVKMSRAPQATQDSAPKGHRWRRLPKLDLRKPVHLTIKLRGGSECWVEVHSRGDFHRYPGYVSIYDVLSDIGGH